MTDSRRKKKLKKVKNMENLLTILKNIECQFQVDGFLDDNKTWTLENHQKFWRDFEGVSAILKHEINKLALVIGNY